MKEKLRIEALLNEYLETLKIAVKALKEIKHSGGQVCDAFEICNHKACRSSYSSWVIADKALKDIAECES